MTRDFAIQKTVILRWLLCSTLVLGLAACCLAQDNVFVSDKDKQFTADVLKRTLSARTVEDKQFCDYVVQKRDNGTLPSHLFYSAYQKAMTKDVNRRSLYFKTALEALCKREGIVLYPTSVKSSPTKPTTSSLSFIPSAVKGLFQRN